MTEPERVEVPPENRATGFLVVFPDMPDHYVREALGIHLDDLATQRWGADGWDRVEFKAGVAEGSQRHLDMEAWHIRNHEDPEVRDPDFAWPEGTAWWRGDASYLPRERRA